MIESITSEEDLGAEVAGQILHREHDLVAHVHLEPARQLLTDEDAPLHAVQVATLSDRARDDRDLRLTLRLDADDAHTRSSSAAR